VPSLQFLAADTLIDEANQRGLVAGSLRLRPHGAVPARGQNLLLVRNAQVALVDVREKRRQHEKDQQEDRDVERRQEPNDEETDDAAGDDHAVPEIGRKALPVGVLVDPGARLDPAQEHAEQKKKLRC
jgi:hypothetical protein